MAIIKPDAVVHGKTDEIIVKVKEKHQARLSSLPLCWISRGGAAGSGVLLGKEWFHGVGTQIPSK